MLGKKTIKTIIKVSIWGFLIINACPQLVEMILDAGGSLLTEGLHWCGTKIWEGIEEKSRESVPEFPGKNWLWDKLWNAPDSSNPFKDWLGKIIGEGEINGRPLDQEDVRIITDIVSKGGTIIERR